MFYHIFQRTNQMTLYMKSKQEYDGKIGLPNYQKEIINLMKQRVDYTNTLTMTLTFKVKTSVQVASKKTIGFINYVKRKLFKKNDTFYSTAIVEDGSHKKHDLPHKKLAHIHGILTKPNDWTYERFIIWIKRKWKNWASRNSSAEIKICDNANKWAWYCNKHLNPKDGATWLVAATYL